MFEEKHNKMNTAMQSMDGLRKEKYEQLHLLNGQLNAKFNDCVKQMIALFNMRARLDQDVMKQYIVNVIDVLLQIVQLTKLKTKLLNGVSRTSKN